MKMPSVQSPAFGENVWSFMTTAASLLTAGCLGCGLAAAEPIEYGVFLDRSRVPVRIYGTEFTDPESAPQLLRDTIATLKRALWPRPLIVHSVGLDEIDAAIRSGQADIVITGSSIYRRNLAFGMRDIATVYTALQPDPDHAIGSLVVVRADNRDISSLVDLKGKTIAVNHPMGFQGLLIIQKEIADLGFDPEKYFKRIDYFGLAIEPRLEAVRDGRADAAIISACWVEKQRQKNPESDPLKNLRPTALRPQTSSQCLASSALYPNYSFLISPRLDVETIRTISNAIHRMPENDAGEGWTMASSFTETDELYRTLKLGPYAYLRSWTPSRIWDEYSTAILIALAAAAAFVLHSFRAQHLVRVRTKQLQDAMEEQEALSKALNALTKRYEASKRAYSVAQISNLVAHDLSQPLSGVLLNLHMLKTILKKLPPDALKIGEAALKAVERIGNRAEKADRIVRLVRAYAKTGKEELRPIDFGAVVQGAVKDFTMSDPNNAGLIELRLDEGSFAIQGSASGLELAIANLLQNAVKAVRGKEAPCVLVTLGAQGQPPKEVVLSVEDNGPEISDEIFESMQAPSQSFSSKGLGFGLSIVRSIAEDHFGRLELARKPGGGLRAALVIPLERRNDDV